MSQTAPIGIFDSGVGGLSILREISNLLPEEKFIYLADSAHCPYGIKPVAQIRERTLEVTQFLSELGVKIIIVACNSACVAGLDQVRTLFADIPVIGVEPALKPAHNLTRNGKIGVLATNLTLKGERFSTLIKKYGTGVTVFTQAAPGLVELVEAGAIDGYQTENLLRQYLEPLLAKAIDTLVLGCTHYPFLSPAIKKICGPEVLLLDTGKAVAKQTARVLEEKKLRGDQPNGQNLFYTTGPISTVTPVIRKLLASPNIEVLAASV